MSDEKDREVLVPEVLPPVRSGRGERAAWREAPQAEAARPGRSGWVDGVANLFGPVVSGAVLDAVHMAPKTKPGMFLAAVLGFWFARVCGLRLGMCFMIAVASAFYSTNGKFLPVATAVGLYFGLRNIRRGKGGGR